MAMLTDNEAVEAGMKLDAKISQEKKEVKSRDKQKIPRRECPNINRRMDQ